MSQPESKLSRAIMAALRNRGAFVFKVHGGAGTMAGVPDIAGVLRGVSIWIETKMPEGDEPSAVQRLRHQQITRAGGYVTVARSVPEAVEWAERVVTHHNAIHAPQRASQPA